MNSIINDFTIRVATVNGSGSQSSNNIILKSLFEMGIPVSGKNIFPSNIAGLPTWYNIRVQKKGHRAHRQSEEVLVLLNPQTFEEDLKRAKPGTVVIYHDKLKMAVMPEGLIYYPVPFQQLVNEACEIASLRKLVINMVYVGVVAELLGIDSQKLRVAMEKQFGKKPKVIDLNWKAIESGAQYVKKNLKKIDPYRVEMMNGNQNKILITGNEAMALGCLFAGCSVFSWYPITPASSLGEALIDYFGRYRRNGEDGHANFAVVQAEDELAAIGMAIGAGWGGARAATSTSGPGLSLMAEFAGLAYYAEVPVVIFDIQRLGPSTGLPTRNAQGDIIFSYFLSHGDTKHLMLLPSTPEEGFEFAMEAFDLADEFQTLVLVLSDLDLGMNNWTAPVFDYPTKPFRRGKVLSKEELEKLGTWERYGDPDGDGVPYRTLPGNDSPKAAYFTRGSGHTAKATYSEKPEEWSWVLDRIAKKFETARKKLPKPVVDQKQDTKIGFIAYGTTEDAIREARDILSEEGMATNYLRIRALPLADEVNAFIKTLDRVYVVEQNQQGQMANVIKMEIPEGASKIRTILNYDGMPMNAEELIRNFKQAEKK